MSNVWKLTISAFKAALLQPFALSASAKVGSGYFEPSLTLQVQQKTHLQNFKFYHFRILHLKYFEAQFEQLRQLITGQEINHRHQT